METAEAGFVAMLMDRMQALEQHNQSLSDQVQALQRRCLDYDHRLSRTLHVRLGWPGFSDDCSIEWKLGQPPLMVVHETDDVGARLEVPLDEAHEQATMFYGSMVVSMSSTESHQAAFDCMKVPGHIGHRTTFGEFWRAVNGWINQATDGSIASLAKGHMYDGLDWTHTTPGNFRLKWYAYA